MGGRGSQAQPVPLAVSVQPPHPLMPSLSSPCYPDSWLNTWNWDGLQVSYVTPGLSQQRPVVVLIHGFGACKEHWRHNLAPLAEHWDIVALDLIGFGASAKPRACLTGEEDDSNAVRYGIDFWAQQVRAFLVNHTQQPVVLVGNSIGGVVALATAELLEADDKPARGVVLVDCAQRAIDDKRVDEQPLGRRLGRPLLKSFVRQRWLTTTLFRSLAQPGVIRAVLRQAYPTGSNVDEALVELLHRATRDEGASESFRGFINLFNDRLATELLASLHTPVSLIWGSKDPWEPLEEAQRWTQFACVQQFKTLEGLGHCPHDEAPEQVNPHLQALIAAFLQPTHPSAA